MANVTPETLKDAQQYVDFVKNNLEPLAAHLKVSVEWLWDIIVMQARVEAIVYLTVSVSLFITTAVLARIFFKRLKTATFGSGIPSTVYEHKETAKIIEYISEDFSNRDKYRAIPNPKTANVDGYICWVTGVATLFLLMISVITAASNLTVIVTGLVNPEFRAIEKIVEYANGARREAQQ